MSAGWPARAAGGLGVGLLLAACGYPAPSTQQGPAATVQETRQPGTDDFNDGAGSKPLIFPDGLQIADLKVGDGPTVQAGQAVTVQYTGWLTDGTKFDSSRDGGRQPLCAILATNPQSAGACTSVIPGWIEGVPGMKVGGKRRIAIPPALGYGSQGQPPTIPPNATLVFDIEVLGIQPLPSPSPT